MRSPRLSASILMASLSTAGTLAQTRPAPPASDPRAIEIAGRVMDALGGQAAWRSTHYLRFTFAVDREGKTVASRTHTWDKWTGNYRLEGTDRDGKPFVVLMNLNSRQGKARKDGSLLEGAELATQLEAAYGAWVNDTYWLLMPYKMMDPGVVLAYDGEARESNTTWDKVLLSFGSVGLTPKDKYWVYVNRETGLVDRWDYVLKGEDKPRTSFAWDGWSRRGRILLAPERRSLKDDTRIHFPLLEVEPALPDETFTAF